MVKNPHSLQGFIYISGSSGSLGFLNHLPERMTECLGLAGFFFFLRGTVSLTTIHGVL